MDIKVLGTGCSKCKTLYSTVQEVVAELSLDAQIEKVEDIVEIMKYNTMTLPALVVDGKVVAAGAVTYQKVKEVLQ